MRAEKGVPSRYAVGCRSMFRGGKEQALADNYEKTIYLVVGLACPCRLVCGAKQIHCARNRGLLFA